MAAAPAARLKVATMALAAGRHGDARAICDEVASLARASHDGELLARTALTAGSELLPGAVDRSLVDLLTEALSAAGGNEVLRSRVEARLAAALQPAADPQVPIRMARDAIARARGAGDPALLLDTIHVAGAALVEMGPDDEQLSLAEELRDRAFAVSDYPHIALGCVKSTPTSKRRKVRRISGGPRRCAVRSTGSRRRCDGPSVSAARSAKPRRRRSVLA
jgi:hypothetical protein